MVISLTKGGVQESIKMNLQMAIVYDRTQYTIPRPRFGIV